MLVFRDTKREREGEAESEAETDRLKGGETKVRESGING